MVRLKELNLDEPMEEQLEKKSADYR